MENHMEYTYRIYEEVYNDILSGKKTIEYRLLNEKSNKIKVGDKIKFLIVNNEAKNIITEVLDKKIYINIDELLNSKEFLSSTLNYTKREFINSLYNIFGKENVDRSKIVGFKIKVVKQ